MKPGASASTTNSDTLRCGVVGVCRSGRDDDEVAAHAVRDEGLRAVDHVLVAVALRGGRNRRQVGAGARLGHRHGGDGLTAGTAGQPLGLLLGAAEGVDVGNDDVGVQAGRPAGFVGSRELFHDDHRVKEVAPGAAVLLFHPRAEKARLTGLEPDLAVDHPLRPPLGLLRKDPGFDELPEVASEDLVFLGK